MNLPCAMHQKQEHFLFQGEDDFFNDSINIVQGSLLLHLRYKGIRHVFDMEFCHA